MLTVPSKFNSRAGSESSDGETLTANLAFSVALRTRLLRRVAAGAGAVAGFVIATAVGFVVLTAKDRHPQEEKISDLTNPNFEAREPPPVRDIQPQSLLLGDATTHDAARPQQLEQQEPQQISRIAIAPSFWRVRE